MAKINVSPKIQQGAEKYLASLRSRRDELSDKQWNIVIRHIKKRRC